MTGPVLKSLPNPVNLPALVARGAVLLRAVGGPFALIGGAAIQAYGHERYTKDVDFAVREFQAGQVLGRWDGEFRELRIGGISLLSDAGAIDLIDRRVDLRALYEEAIDATTRQGFCVEAGGETVPVAPSEYIIAMKMAAGRPQDDSDVAFLLRRSELSYPATRDVVQRHLGYYAARALDRLARQLGRPDAPIAYDD